MLKIVTIWTTFSLAYIAGVLIYRHGTDGAIAFMNGYERSVTDTKKSLELARDNRLLKAENSKLTTEVGQLQAQNRSLVAQNNKQQTQIEPSRKIASIPSNSVEDFVMYEVYRWTPDKMLAIGEKELFFKNYQKSAQFYHELIVRFPRDKMINDRVLFGAGVAAYESKKNFNWAAQHLQALVQKYPQSPYYRGAKLWLALSHLNLGEEKKFVSTVEEFRQKYRNTEEWKILSKHYENISYKFKK